jgi:cell division topological specificity factor
MEEDMSLLDLFKKKGSGDVAKDRLKLLLVSDRANCSPEVMEMIKNDIIKVISKYMVIDAEGLDIQITSTESEGDNGSVSVSIITTFFPSLARPVPILAVVVVLPTPPFPDVTTITSLILFPPKLIY